MRSPLSHIHAPRHRDQPVASTRPEQKHPNGNMRTYPPDIAARLAPTSSASRRRDLSARIVEADLRAGDANGALTRGLALLQGGTLDDASDRTSRALDRPGVPRVAAAKWSVGRTRTRRKHESAVALSFSRTDQSPLGSHD